MNLSDRQAFLAEVHIGVLAVERPGRAPLAVPLWYDYTPGGDVVIWTQADSVKAKLVREAGRFSLSVQNETPPYKYVTAEGDVTSIGDPTEEDVLHMSVRYLGEEDGKVFAEQNAGGSVLIRMRPTKWISADLSA